jgi:hypothetical protein
MSGRTNHFRQPSYGRLGGYTLFATRSLKLAALAKGLTQLGPGH